MVSAHDPLTGPKAPLYQRMPALSLAGTSNASGFMCYYKLPL